MRTRGSDEIRQCDRIEVAALMVRASTDDVEDSHIRVGKVASTGSHRRLASDQFHAPTLSDVKDL